MNNTNNQALASLSNTDRKMLELLLKGASGRTIAQTLGYKDGTTRVYLHALYKRLGVRNKTNAVTWYIHATIPTHCIGGAFPCLSYAGRGRKREDNRKCHLARGDGGSGSNRYDDRISPASVTADKEPVHLSCKAKRTYLALNRDDWRLFFRDGGVWVSLARLPL